MTVQTSARALLGVSLGSLCSRAGAMALNLVFNLLVARELGAAASGLLFTALSLAIILAVPGRLGLDTSLVRLASPLWAAGRLGQVSALWFRALGLTLACASAVTTLAFLAAPHLSEQVFSEPRLTEPMRLIALGILPLSMIALTAGVMKVLHRPALASSFEAGAVPAVFLLIAAALAAGGWPMTLAGAAGAYALAAAISALSGFLVLRRALPARTTLAAGKSLVGESLPIMGIDLMNVVLAIGLIPVLALVAGAPAAGVFNAAVRLTAPLGVVLLVLNNVYSPRLATALANGRSEAVANLCRGHRATGLAVAIPAAALLSWFDEIPGLLFGAEFAGAGAMVPILCLGHVMALAFGPMGLVLIHAGEASRLRRILILTVILTLPLTAVLGLLGGGVGAALAALFSLVLPRWLSARHAARLMADAGGGRLRIGGAPIPASTGAARS